MSEFEKEIGQRIRAIEGDAALRAQAGEFMAATIKAKYSYNFHWLGRPIIQYPQDMIAMQEILWRVRPDLVIETGVAHGGSLVFYASLCELMQHGRVLGIDIDIRAHNRAAIEAHPMASRISLLQGSSTDPAIVRQVHELARGQRVLLVLDSNHTHEHVLEELEAYAGLVSPGSYCVVFDTVVEDLAPGSFPDRPWDRGDNPRTAVREFLRTHPEFEVDEDIELRLLLTVAPGGYLRRR